MYAHPDTGEHSGHARRVVTNKPGTGPPGARRPAKRGKRRPDGVLLLGRLQDVINARFELTSREAR